jgi:hypothetical protein
VSKQLEAVDFYSGHKETLRYLGTIWVEDGSPDGLRARQRFTDESTPEGELYVEADYLTAVAHLLEDAERSTNGSDKWPHPYRNSIKTPWTYRYQTGAVQVYQGGYLVFTIYCNGGREPYQYFPNLGVTRAT